MAQSDLQDLSNSGNVKLSDISLYNTDNSVTNVGLQGNDLKAVASVVETSIGAVASQAMASQNAQSAQISADLASKQIASNTITNATKWLGLGVVAFFIFKILRKRK